MKSNQQSIERIQNFKYQLKRLRAIQLTVIRVDDTSMRGIFQYT